MKKVLAFKGSPRKNGNSTLMLHQFLMGVEEASGVSEIYDAHEIHLEYCKGCLRCNVLGRCSIENDDWKNLSTKILDSDVIVFSSPVYFHHLTAPIKKIIDRFRSFVQVQITETGLQHTPWHMWRKDFVLLLSMGSYDDYDAEPVAELFQYMCNILGQENKLHIIKAKRLAVSNQIIKSKKELELLYPKLKIPPRMAHVDYRRNQVILNKCHRLGSSLLL